MSQSSVRLSAADRELLDHAREVAHRAYAPYSGFHVGAAIRARDGSIVTGANVENASYPLGICAERAAVACGVSRGYGPGDVEAIAITASPCGGCRQWLLEFNIDRVVFVGPDDELVVDSAADLLPRSFRLA